MILTFFISPTFLGYLRVTEAATRSVLYNTCFKGFAKFTEKHLCQALFLRKLEASGNKETLAQLFSCEFRKNFRKKRLLLESIKMLAMEASYNFRGLKAQLRLVRSSLLK